MRITKGKTGSRRSHHGLSAPRLSHDKETDSTHKRHHVDLETGMYRGKKIFEPKVKVAAPVAEEKEEKENVVEEVVEEVKETAEEVKEKVEEIGEEIKEEIEEVVEAVTEEKKEEK
jgi:large subunit ribosomal protein L32